MREKTVKRYFCEYCRRSGGSKFHMAKHERGCTNNPARICTMHEFIGGGEDDTPVSENVAFLTASGFTALRAKVENCPACLLATLRQSDDPLFDQVIEFDFKVEREAFWEAYREEYNAEFRALVGPVS